MWNVKSQKNGECGPGSKIINYVHSKWSKKAVCLWCHLSRKPTRAVARSSVNDLQAKTRPSRHFANFTTHEHQGRIIFILSYHHTTGRWEANFTNTKKRCFSCLYCKKPISFIIDRSILYRLAKKNSLIEVRLPWCCLRYVKGVWW